jgi:hypothetical protein
MHQKMLEAQKAENSSDKKLSDRLLRNRLSELLFLYTLFLETNKLLLDFLRPGGFREAALSARIELIGERIYSSILLTEVQKALADTPYPLDAKLALGSKAPELDSALQECRAEICDLLSDARAIGIAAARINAQYFLGITILFKS